MLLLQLQIYLRLWHLIVRRGLQLKHRNSTDFKTNTLESLSTLPGTSPMTLYIMILTYRTLETKLKDSADTTEEYPNILANNLMKEVKTTR